MSKLIVSVAFDKSIVGSSEASFQFKTCLEEPELDFDPHPVRAPLPTSRQQQEAY
ncbi:hypothetical protein LRN_1654 [Ligilactobacillus ruminis DPC 6832]|uniref:Uncharacterized protein n=1 Tax=Ligilactobacillus ruminis DPC 6832 TaxID=1402208 RepID=A0A837DXC1_9LACO|nr:hypothetical protein LRN_1654 [Ligilactobacillus ruminis DPC 6832]